MITEPDDLRFALDLTEYGRRLHENLQPPADPPFARYFRDHGLFFGAQLGRGAAQKAFLLVAGRQSGRGRSPWRLDDFSVPTGSLDSPV